MDLKTIRVNFHLRFFYIQNEGRIYETKNYICFVDAVVRADVFI